MRDTNILFTFHNEALLSSKFISSFKESLTFSFIFHKNTDFGIFLLFQGKKICQKEILSKILKTFLLNLSLFRFSLLILYIAGWLNGQSA